jgi:hypothetical protein
MSRPSEPATLVLHALRLKGFADTDAVAAHTGIPEDDAAGFLVGFAEQGLAQRREGRITGWSLTPTGRARDAKVIAAELDAAGCRPDVDSAYRQFLTVNADVLRVCTDWQVRDGGVNDHIDSVYDKGVVGRLRELHDRIAPVLAQLADCLDRFASYPPRLGDAVERIEAGDGDWFTKPVVDSYHTVWFELHEDLLSTLGIERSKEEAPH